MKRYVIALCAILIGPTAAMPAEAGVIISSFTVGTNPLNSGSSELLTAVLTATADPAFNSIAITGGNIRFDPGNGGFSITQTYGNIGAGATFTQAFTYTGSPGQIFIPTVSYFTNYTETASSGERFNTNTAGGVTANVQITPATTAAIPEPMTFSLFGAGLAGLVVARRRKKLSA